MPGLRSKQVEMYLVMVDVTWSLLWLIQLLVQSMLTARHRIYKLTTIRFLAALYVLQVLLTMPLCLHLYNNINTKNVAKRNVGRAGVSRLVGTRRRASLFGGAVHGPRNGLFDGRPQGGCQ